MEQKSDLIEKNLASSDDVNTKAHPWRRCAIGKHFVREHITHRSPNKQNSNGVVATVHEHCADNPSHKDELSYDEIQYISKTYFPHLSGLPTAGALTVIFSKADDYDVEIRGWVQYWNYVFQPDNPLDPNLVKALMGTESSFEKKPKGISKAYGLMQLLPETFQILRNTKGELKDYLIRVPKSEYIDPSVNICASIRWLFQKKKLAVAKMKRPVSWEEAIIEYKSYWEVINAGIDPEPMQRLRKFYGILQGEG